MNGGTVMAARERRPMDDNEVIAYVATLIFIVAILAIAAHTLTGCTTSLAY